jgi:hypothetical protein
MEALNDDIGFLLGNLPPEHMPLVDHVCCAFSIIFSRQRELLFFFESFNKPDLELQWALHCQNKPHYDIKDKEVENVILYMELLIPVGNPFRKLVHEFLLKAYKILRSLQDVHFAELELFVSKKLNNY